MWPPYFHAIGSKTVRRRAAPQPVFTRYKLLEIERPPFAKGGMGRCAQASLRRKMRAGQYCTSAEVRDRSRVIAWQSAVHLQRRSSRCRTQFAA